MKELPFFIFRRIVHHLLGAVDVIALQEVHIGHVLFPPLYREPPSS